MNRYKKRLYASVVLIGCFIVWTWMVLLVDVRAIGPNGSHVGLAAINLYVHRLTGVHFALYTITDWLGLVPFAVSACFACLGLKQWIERKNLKHVDRSILILGCYYILVIALYVLFEAFTVNYRPVLIGGRLEASYPSSTTMLVLCVIPTALMQINKRCASGHAKRCTNVLGISFMIFMVVCRLFSGVHWFSDIIGGALLSSGLVMLYDGVCAWVCS